ncbi:MAG: phosphatase PAP2 family protein [Gemmatimonadetes bacterium]|nr:phosphatase PAP2 family protein [Gemmatimonadota bacterium]
MAGGSGSGRDGGARPRRPRADGPSTGHDGGRARPGAGRGTFHFTPGRGWKQEQGSFPSGHASSSFTAAAVVTGEMSRWSPHLTVPVEIIMYGGATAVGLSRIFENRHWATDVVAGAALGYLVGSNVVAHAYRDSREAEQTPETNRVGSSRFPPIPIFYMAVPSR